MFPIGDIDPESVEKIISHIARHPSDSKNIHRAAAMIVANLNKPRTHKGAANQPASQRILPEPCKAAGRNQDIKTFEGALHAVCHCLTGRCVPVRFCQKIDPGNVTGRCYQYFDGSFSVDINENMDNWSLLRTALHEFGHVKSIADGDLSEDHADFLRDVWLAWANEHVKNDYSQSTTPIILKALLKYPRTF